MARITVEIIELLRRTAHEIERSTYYEWGHMGACNCGFLAQQVTQLSKAEIDRRALQRYGDWNEQLNDYCPTSGLPFDQVISDLLDIGFDIDDLKHLERLSHPAVLKALGGRNLLRNRKEDVVLYIRTWAREIENQLLDEIAIEIPETATLTS